jgi:glycine cleavage system H protein
VQIPENLKYTREHEWLRLDDGDQGTVGITDFAQDSLGDVVFLDLPAIGRNLEQNAKFGEIESVKAVSELYSPVSGEVTEVNSAVNDAPELINSDPYGKGWLIKISVSDRSQVDSLLSAADYKDMTAEG